MELFSVLRVIGGLINASRLIESFHGNRVEIIFFYFFFGKIILLRVCVNNFSKRTVVIRFHTALRKSTYYDLFISREVVKNRFIVF